MLRALRCRPLITADSTFARSRISRLWLFAPFSRQSFYRRENQICLGCGSPITSDSTKPGYLKIAPESSGTITTRALKRDRESNIFASTLANLDEDLRSQLVSETLDSSSSSKVIGTEPASKSILCTRCHSLKHHSCLPNTIVEDKASSFDIYSKIRQDPDAIVVNVIDIMDYPLSLLDLRKHIGTRPRIINVFNRADILFKKPLLAQEVRQRLAHMLKDCSSEDEKLDVRFLSALKGWEVDKLANSLRTRRKGTNIYFVGSANAGKSSLISSLGKRSKSDAIQNPTTSHVPGTTLASIPTEIELFGEVLGGGRGSVVDLPGVLKPGFSAFIKADAMQQALPHKHIKAAPVSLRIGESMILGDLIQIDLVGGDSKHILVTPYTHLKPHCTSRPGYILSKPSGIRTEDTPTFETALEREFRVRGKGGQNVVDLVFKDVGFLSVALFKGSATIRVKSPGGLHVGLREPPIIENSYVKV